MSAVEVIAAHQHLGATKFSHRNGQAWVEYPKCGCGERMHPGSHARHVAEALAAAGYDLADPT